MSRSYRFHILDVELTLSGPRAVVGPVAFAFRRFRVAGTETAVPRRIAVELLDDATLQMDGRRYPLVPEVDVRFQLMQRLHAALMDAVESCAVLHAAALVGPRGTACILAGPSGRGKSSLALELCGRGFRLLSDDFAPLDLDRRTVLPYPRAIGVIPHPAGPLSEPFRSQALDGSGPEMFGKRLLDPGELTDGGLLAAAPAPLRHVFLLRATGCVERETSLVDLAARPAFFRELAAVISRTPGVEVLGQRVVEGLRCLRLRLHHAAHPTEALAPYFENDGVVYFDVRWDVEPDFSGEPEIVPVGRRRAAEALAREMLNRRIGGRLLARKGGPLRLFVDLAAALGQADCRTVRVGDCKATADAIERTAGAAGP